MINATLDQINKVIKKNIKDEFLEKDTNFFELQNFLTDENNNESSTSKLIQRHRQTEIKEEIKRLFKIAESLDIEIILFKGIAEAYDLYSDPNERPSNDIDILIRPCDVVKFSIACKSLGYKYGEEEIIPKLITRDLRYKSHHHINKFLKKEKMLNIYLELHVAVSTSWFSIKTSTGNNFIEAVFLHKTPFLLDNKTIFVCDVYDRFIFALQHAARHTFDNIGTKWYYSKQSFIKYNLKTLVDGILILEKYREDICDDILYERIELYGFSEDIIFANKMSTELLGITPLNNDILEVIQKYKCNFWKDQIYRNIRTTYNCKDLCSKNLSDINKEVIKKCLENNPQYLCEYGKSNFKILIDEKFDSLTKNRFGTICRSNLIPKNDYNGKISMHYDEHKLYIEFDIYDPIVMVGGTGRDNKWTESINIIMYNPNFNTDKSGITTGIFISPIINDKSEYGIKALYIGEWQDKRSNKPFPLDEQDASFKITETGYLISLQLTWENLGINYSNLNYLGMDFVFNNVDTNDAALDAVLCWSNPMCDYYNPTTFGMVKFIKN